MKKIISDEVVKSIENRKSILQWIPKSFEKYINEETVLVRDIGTSKDGKKTPLSKEVEVKIACIFDLTHKLISKTCTLETDTYNLNAKVFRRLYGKDYKYVVKFLVDFGFMKKTKNHCAGKFSREYKINSDLFMKPDTKIRFHNTNNTIVRKYKQNFYSSQFLDICAENDETESTLTPIKRQLAFDLLFVEIDEQAAIEYLDSLYKTGVLSNFAYNKNLMSIDYISHKQPYYTNDKYGRFHTNLTTLKGHIRGSFLKIDGHPVAETDIKNCQPRLLAQLLKLDGFDKKHPDEFKRYLDTVKNGLIYEEIMSEASIPREEAKTVMYTVLFGKNKHCKPTQIFKRLYPNILQWIKVFKGDTHEILAHKLQNMESNLIFDHICIKIKKDIPEIRMFTVHDSIYYPEYLKDRVEDIFYKEVERLF